MYIVYTTIWSEGEVVAHTTDKRFAIGYNAVTGNIQYANSLQELYQIPSFNLIVETDNEEDARKLDTAMYPRIKS